MYSVVMAAAKVPVRPAVPEPDFCTEPHVADPAVLSDVKTRLLGGQSVAALADVFKLLGAPTRVRSLAALTRTLAGSLKEWRVAA